MNNKVLVTTLNYNLPQLTDDLINLQINTSTYQNKEVIVIDNGSDSDKIPKTATHRLSQNIFYGGGVNIIFQYFLQSDCDYVLILNNDIFFHGKYFINNLVQQAVDNDLAIISPSVINATPEQCFWKQMQWWGSNAVRTVKWVDWQCPMIRRDLAEKIKQFPNELLYGWGLDILSAMIAEDNNLSIGVSDLITIAHLNSHTVKTMTNNLSSFNRLAESNMFSFFNKPEYIQRFIDYRNYGAKYTI